MTTLREAAQQALDIFDSEFTMVDGEFCRWCDGRLKAKHNCLLEQTITALKTALAEPVQEPVAWTGYDLDAMVEAFDRVIEAHFSKAHPFHDPTNMDAKMALRILRGFIPAMKAYTAPPQRKPLTQEEITVALAPANPVEIGETHNDDPLAATRRAIVRAAAELGRSMT